MRTKLSAAKAMRVVLPMALGVLLPLSASPAHALFLLWVDGGGFAYSSGEKPGGEWGSLALPQVAAGAAEVWYEGRSESRVGSLSGEREVERWRADDVQGGASDLWGNFWTQGSDPEFAKVEIVRIHPPINPVPEPATLMLLGGGLLALGAGRARRKIAT